ncbi:hypothetical protein ACFU7Y_43935 [Kitasatospora sp. NPDC057542]|nr:hypothetical protein [Streptomyces sp. LS1784]
MRSALTWDFSIPPQTTLPGGTVMGQHDGLSKDGIQAVATMYT